MRLFNRQVRTLMLAAILAIMIDVQTVFAQQPQNYTGNGGKEISLTIYVPQSFGLEKNRSYIPALVQGGFVSNFKNYSAISILDWERLDDIYTKLIDDAYDDNASAKQDVVLGRLAPTSHFLTGNIIRTETGYNIKVNITATADKMTVATYSGTFSSADLDNLTGIRKASLELLQQVGVVLTEKAQQELTGAAEANQVSAQTALAKGVTAQMDGTVIAALSYYYQAASFDPALNEAVKRSTVVAANISSGNIGADIRNDILWRKKWVATLQETEETVNRMMTMIKNKAANPPYMIAYFPEIKTGKINYQTETADLSITVSIGANLSWFSGMMRTLKVADQATNVVLDGLNATNRKSDWGLKYWPKEGVSNTNPFASIRTHFFGSKYLVTQKNYDITVVFELVNQRGLVIGSATFRPDPEKKGFRIHREDSQFTVEIMDDSYSTCYVVSFNGVKANDISDNMTIRVVSVNGMSPQQARITITSGPLVESSPLLIDNRDGKKYNTVKISGITWMAENLRYRPATGNSWCYENNNSNCDKYGMLYDQNTAKEVCPPGWHLPDEYEWDDYLGDMVGGIDVAGKKLKSKSNWNKNGNGTDDYGFSALPSGWRQSNGGFNLIGDYGCWWGATKPRVFTYDRNSISGLKNATDAGGLSVRCVADY